MPVRGVCSQVLDLPGILMALHAYFTSLGYDEIRRLGAANDKALRMAKTLLHELCKHAVRPLALFRCSAISRCAAHAQFALCCTTIPDCAVMRPAGSRLTALVMCAGAPHHQLHAGHPSGH